MSGEASHHWGRSIFAVLAGVLFGAALSLGVDEVLHVLKIYPPWGERMSDGLFVLAAAYRLVFSVLCGYVIAQLAPNRPMVHALVGGVIGLVVSVAGAVATWNMDIGPHWYSVLLAVMALPCAWAGGALWKMRARERRPA
jgi:hypothetical protein